MKKTTTRIVYAGMFLTAALVLGQKMFMEEVIDDDRAHTRTGSAGSAISGGHGRNMSGVEDSVKIVGINGSIGDFSVDGDSILFTSEDSIYENEDQPGGNSYDNVAYNPGDSEKVKDSHGRNGNNSIHTSPAGGTVTSPASSGRAGRLHAGGNGNGEGGLGGGGGGWGGNGAGGKGDTGKDPASNAPGSNTGTTPSEENAAAPAHEDKSDADHGSMPGRDDDDGDKPTSGNPSDKEIPPEYFDAPPGRELNDPFQPQIPAKEVGDEGTKTYENPEAKAIYEPGSSLLIGLGGVMLLWLRRRGSPS